MKSRARHHQYPFALYAAGFSAQEPVFDQIANDTSSPQRIAANAPIMAFWILFYGAEAGDHIDTEILDPEGRVYIQNQTIQEKKKIRAMRYIGTRTQTKPLHAGTYAGRATLWRLLPGGQTITRSISSSVVVGNGN